MIILLLGTHLFLTIRLKLPQRYIFQAIKLSMKKDVSSSGDVSQLGALATALAATIGTGNIVGVATAVALGGPGAALTKFCFDKIPYVGSPLLAFGILTFAFSTILGWSYYGKSAMWYLFGKKGTAIYLIAYVVCLFIGSLASLGLIWDIADTMNALMAIPNLVSLLLLSGVIVSETRRFLWSNRLDEKDE